MKVTVLDKCVIPALTYACELWGKSYHDVEVIYRYALKTALGARPNTNNEICYIELDRYPLERKIKRLQQILEQNTYLLK